MLWLGVAVGIGIVLSVLGFLLRKPSANNNPNMEQQSPMERAIEEALSDAARLLETGQTWDAEQRMVSLVEQVSQEAGTTSREYALALFNQAMLFLWMDDNTRAIPLLRTACEIAEADESMTADLLTFQENLGVALSQNGVHSEAVELLQESLNRREKFFGRNHSGYACGLTSCAEALTRAGKPDEALPLIEEAIKIDQQAQNSSVIEEIALKSIILQAQNEEDIFPNWSDLPAKLQSEIPEVVHRMSRTHQPNMVLGLYQKLRPLYASSQPRDLQKLKEIDVAISNLARQVENHPARIAAFQRIMENIGEHHPESVNTLLGMAMAYTDAGQTSSADDAYESALRVSSQNGPPASQAQVQRNYAIHLAETARIEPAKQMHQEAIGNARKSGNEELLGRTLCAYGIFLQHAGQTEGVVEFLEESLLALPKSHPDALSAESHLVALREGDSCQCSETNIDSYLDFLKKLVLDRAPEGLVDQITYDEADLESPVSVSVTREPTEEESQQLFNAIQNSLTEIRMSSSRAFYTE
ncbi:tetratricopeptide repeat protein [Thalassoglobus polymorphus]|uniref:Tetratricopeptide repeat protein n=1 Tax=Thalassoglobus polymorphus TaxID=2527994 RepID=A0A517QQJ3_9PLAN|nr:tetratricopeptide repeat protein [Thalassoglobus polymorphus]QDT33906.1 Tetratricopeptide repeat protein [Thalassoglobus polymorphus]